MAKAEGFGDGVTQHNVSMQMGNLPRDLLQRFMLSSNHFSHKIQQQSGEDGEEIELSLGLSLNGRFGVDPRAKKLTRSSSIPDFITTPVKRESNESSPVLPVVCGPLVRTCSLPTQTEEEWRKRKELQTLRRMEAKRKRSEKQRNLRAARERSRGLSEENCEEDRREEAANGNSNGFVRVGVTAWVNGGRGAFGTEDKGEKTNDSIGSQGSGSSVVSELEKQSIQGSTKCSEARSPASVQSASEGEQKPVVIPGRILTERSGKFKEIVVENQVGKPTVPDKCVKEVVRNVLEDMPCVSTTGEGPNGKRIEGFLYRYRKGEEVRIVCVCHGSFLSPAEFVKHAGGGDVAHPLKHIVVNSSSLL